MDGKLLNLANLIIENGTIKKDINAKNSISSDWDWKKWNESNEGVTENVIKSEKESNWTPILVFASNIFAKYPSKKSKREPNKTKIKANAYPFRFKKSTSMKIKTIARQPHNPLRIVSKFGSILISFNW